MEHRWSEIDRGKPKYSGKNLSQCHFVHHKSHMDRPGIRLPLCLKNVIKPEIYKMPRTSSLNTAGAIIRRWEMRTVQYKDKVGKDEGKQTSGRRKGIILKGLGHGLVIFKNDKKLEYSNFSFYLTLIYRNVSPFFALYSNF
jgi:hypothetical protein